MRTFTLFLMLALLPVRIWAADDMAFSMAKMAAGASVLQDAQPLRSHTSNMPEDCPMMAVGVGKWASVRVRHVRILFLHAFRSPRFGGAT